MMKNHESLSNTIYNKSTNKLSAPNLSIDNGRNLANSRDFAFSPADLLPTDDSMEELSFCSRLKDIVFWSIKISFLFLVSVNLIALIIDPTPLLRVYDFITRPSVLDDYEKSEIPKTINKNNDFNHLFAKLHILKEDLDALKKKLDNIDEWRLNFEYETSKVYRKNVEEIEQHFSAMEKRIEDALSTYDADKVGLIDYALETAGGKIISTPDTIPYPSSVSWDFGYFQLFTPSSASQIIQAGHLPGQCFAFHGKTGRIRIRLAEKIKITSVTLEHSPFRLLSDISSCPKNFVVLGLEKPEDNNGIKLGHFIFKDNTALQNFKIDFSFKNFQYVELFIMDNYGKKEYTCIYRIRVHGLVDDKDIEEK